MVTITLYKLFVRLKGCGKHLMWNSTILSLFSHALFIFKRKYFTTYPLMLGASKLAEGAHCQSNEWNTNEALSVKLTEGICRCNYAQWCLIQAHPHVLYRLGRFGDFNYSHCQSVGQISKERSCLFGCSVLKGKQEIVITFYFCSFGQQLYWLW